MNELTVSRLLHLVLYLLGFLILWEWIRPLETISDVGDSQYFVIFIVMVLIANFFSIKLLWKTLVVFLYISFVSYSLYYGSNPMFGLEWFILFIGDFIRSIQAIVQLDWNEVTNSFRTFLFFILLWMMTYLLHYWLIVRRRILLFVFLSMAFVATLDTFTPYDGDWAIIRLVIFGVILLGMLTLLRLTEKEKITISIAEYPRWFIPLCVWITLTISAGYFAPKPVAQWPDPLPFIISTSEKFTGNNSVGKTVGYDEDDSKLGGDFTPDDAVVFTSRSSSRHYWFIESKHVYTGLGWKKPADMSYEVPIKYGETVWVSSTQSFEDKQSEVRSDSISIKKKENHIPHPSPFYNTVILTDDQLEVFIYDYQTNKMKIGYSDDSGSLLNSYNVIYRAPVYPIDRLRSAGTEEIAFFYDTDYTQLPDGLPSRIKELAESITEKETNVYDKAKAVERYFDSMQFTYAREDVPYPDDGVDFVDHFLFDTKRGYCDHFSTSMVVMLRSLDIPARWVKGYSTGTYIGMEDGKSLYEVTNNNAHSWVEVYLNGFGWVPFEPTKGYNMNIDIEYNLSLNPSEANPSQPSETPQSQPQEQQPMIPEEGRTEEAKQESNVGEQLKEHFADNLKAYAFTIVVLVSVSFLVFALRGKWRPYIWLWRYNRSRDDEVFFKAYGALLKELSRYGIKRQSEQTLREYANRVDQHFSSAEMKKLTSYYEKIIYGNRSASAIWEEVKPLWEIMMRKTIT